MSDPRGPWDPPEPPRRQSNFLGLSLWLGLIAALILAFWWLPILLPDRNIEAFDYAWVIGLTLFVALMTRGLVAASRTALWRGLKDIMLWLVIAAFLVVVVTFQDDLRPAGARVLSALIPGYAVQADADTLVVTASPDGHFRMIGSVNRAPVTFLVDTGATNVVLSPADAARAGFDIGSLTFSRVFETANGIGRGAPVNVANFAVGPIKLTNARVTVNQAEMRESLLGMAFLANVSSFEVRGQTLFIRWR